MEDGDSRMLTSIRPERRWLGYRRRLRLCEIGRISHAISRGIALNTVTLVSLITSGAIAS